MNQPMVLHQLTHVDILQSSLRRRHYIYYYYRPLFVMRVIFLRKIKGLDVW